MRPIPDSFFLNTIDDEVLDNILKLSESSFVEYINLLIEKFYPSATEPQQIYLRQAYLSSFILEKIYRTNPAIANGFTCIHTKTGLIKELINDIYEITSERLEIN